MSAALDSSQMRSHAVYFRVEDDIHRELLRIAKIEDRPISYVVARIVRAGMPNAKPSVERKKA